MATSLAYAPRLAQSIAVFVVPLAYGGATAIGLEGEDSIASRDATVQKAPCK